MAVHRFQTSDGVIHRVEAPTREAAEAELTRALAHPNVGADVVKSAGTGALEGLTGATQTPLTGLASRAGEIVANLAAGRPAMTVNPHPSIVKTAGLEHTPQTGAGALARTMGQFLPGAAVPGSIPSRVANVVLPALGSEGAGGIARAAGAPPGIESIVRMLGAMGGGVAASARLTPGPVPAPPSFDTNPAAALSREGVSLTPGQRIGGLAKSAEDTAMRSPILGWAIRDARKRGVASLTSVAANRALAPIGETVPAGLKPGNRTVAHVADRLGATYDKAADMVPAVSRDATFDNAMAEIGKSVTELPADVQGQFANIIKNRLGGRFEPGQTVTGKQLRGMQSEIGKLAADFGSHDDPAQQALGHALEGVSYSLADTLGRANPAAADLIGKANEGYANYVRLRNAASRAKGGVASPAQLMQAVRQSDRSVGKGDTAKGQSLMYDLANAASEVMPDTFGNPGTADALGVAGLGTSIVTAPHVGIPAAMGLTAGAIPYALMGRGAPRQTMLPTLGQGGLAGAIQALQAGAKPQLSFQPPPGLLESLMSLRAP